ncbi:MAG: transcriptional regulator, AsnC family [uncultured Paraburkholderia sp.]|nr:MAG: transcriptional regulator, AsnC family [uncultured Paraburkholderia sp.]CAH2807872.1 MAG: transcriptional regulator, AsnC family [uncultured Paraburkholderia sp.]CAH2943049.1 MAG: transcriptional regulator, AsnC family [uncultured Paraburkholderia sp.]CAH2943998.1 MAG: transcriptional regulator, AsnC family [uncultured Paraburkholderia sp.]
MTRSRQIIRTRHPDDATAQNDDSHSCSKKFARIRRAVRASVGLNHSINDV